MSIIPPINASSSYYDDIVYMHMDLNTRIHFTGQFLPWHRWFMYSHEQALKIKCGYTGVSPYWNWTIDASDFFESSFMEGLESSKRRSSSLVSFASCAAPELHTSAVADFPPPFNVFFTDHQKEANSSFPTPEIEKPLETPAGDYKGFQAAFETFEGAHGSVHLIVGGDLGGQCPQNAPSNCVPGSTLPLFWMHHAMVDKVWYDSQNRNSENPNSFFGGTVRALQSLDTYKQYPNGGPPFLNLSSTMPADGMFPEVTIGDVMNATSGILCYIYE